MSHVRPSFLVFPVLIGTLAGGCYPLDAVFGPGRGDDGGPPAADDDAGRVSLEFPRAPVQETALVGLPPVPTPRDAGVADSGRPIDWGPTECRESDDIALTVDPGETPRPSTIEVTARLVFPQVDVYVLVDERGSLFDERAALETGLEGRLRELACAPRGEACIDGRCIGEGEICDDERASCIESPAVAGCVPDLRVGLGTYHGGPASFRHRLDLSPLRPRHFEEVPWAEEGPTYLAGRSDLYRTLRCLAEDCKVPGCGTCPAFRPEAESLVVVITDAEDGCLPAPMSPCPTEAEVLDAFADRDGTLRVLAVDSSENEVLRDIGPLTSVRPGSGEDAPFAVEAALRDRRLLRASARLDLRPLAAPDVSLLVDYVAVDESCGTPGVDSNGDGRPDRYVDVVRGTELCFRMALQPAPAFGRGVGTAELRALSEGRVVDRWSVCVEGR